MNDIQVDNKSALTALFVIDSLEIGGAEQSLFENLRRFSNVKPIVCHLYKGETLKSSFEKEGITVYSLNVSGKYGFIEAAKKLTKIVRKTKPQGLVAYLTRSELVSRYVAKKLKIPVFGTFVSDLYSDEYNRKLSAKARVLVTIFKSINRFTARYCRGFIANSESTKKVNCIHLKVNPEKVVVINRGRDGSRFHFHNNRLNSERIKLISIGRLVGVKGHQDLIRAVAVEREQGRSFELDIAGEGPERVSLEKLINELNLNEVVRLLGSRKDIPELVQEYDAFFFGSHSEGFSGSIVEAMMAGLPVIVSGIPVNKEVVTHLETGYIFEKASIESAAKALEWLNSNKQEALKMAEKANQIARERFELNTIAKEFESYLLQQLQ